MNIHKITLILLCLAFITGCVSKKKYLELEQSSNNKIAQLNKEKASLETRIKTMIADYEQMKSDLLATNANKDQMITNLHSEVNSVSKNAASSKSDMEDKIYAYEYEKRQLQSKIDKYESSIENLTSKNNELALQISTATTKTNSAIYDLERKDSEIDKLNKKISNNNETVEKYKSQIDKLNSEITTLKKQSAEKNQTIERLENNVKLLKGQLK